MLLTRSTPCSSRWKAVSSSARFAAASTCSPTAPRDLYIDNLGTAPSHQRRGVASAMMKAMLDWGKAQGCAYAWVATEPDNEQAKGFYAAQRYTSDTIALFARELS